MVGEVSICLIYPNAANLNQSKPLNSHQRTPFAPLLASGRISRTVKYASACPRLREATSRALWHVFPRHRLVTLGFRLMGELLRDKDKLARFCPQRLSLRPLSGASALPRVNTYPLHQLEYGD